MKKTITLEIESTSEMLDDIKKQNLQKIATTADAETLQILAELAGKPRINEKLKSAMKNPLFKNKLNKD
jgi:hypothetical protein